MYGFVFQMGGFILNWRALHGGGISFDEGGEGLEKNIGWGGLSSHGKSNEGTLKS